MILNNVHSKWAGDNLTLGMDTIFESSVSIFNFSTSLSLLSKEYDDSFIMSLTSQLTKLHTNSGLFLIFSKVSLLLPDLLYPPGPITTIGGIVAIALKKL